MSATMVIVGGHGGMSDRYREVAERLGWSLRHFEQRIPQGLRHGGGRVDLLVVMLDKLSHALRDQLKALVGDATTRAAYGGFWGAPGRCAPHTRAAARTDPWRAEPNLSTTCPAEERT